MFVPEAEILFFFFIKGSTRVVGVIRPNRVPGISWVPAASLVETHFGIIEMQLNF